MNQTSRMLKTSSIILFIFGILSVIILALGAAGLSFLGATVTGSSQGALVAGGLFVLISIFGIVVSVIQVIAGHKGIKAANGEGNPHTCKGLGITLLVLRLISAVISFIGEKPDMTTIIGTIISLAIIMCYIKGARDMCE